MFTMIKPSPLLRIPVALTNDEDYSSMVIVGVQKTTANTDEIKQGARALAYVIYRNTCMNFHQTLYEELDKLLGDAPIKEEQHRLLGLVKRHDENGGEYE